MSNYKCTPISINASDTTEYLGTKTNLTSTILQSTKQKVKVLDFFIFWGSLHFVDQHRNPAKSKIQCLTIDVHLPQCIKYHM